jgi:hypothetical protein
MILASASDYGSRYSCVKPARLAQYRSGEAPKSIEVLA